MTAPSSYVKNAAFVTQAVDRGPAVSAPPPRTLAVLESEARSPLLADQGERPGMAMPTFSGMPGPQLFEGLDNVTVTKKRGLYFSQVVQAGGRPKFYITVNGATPTVFDPNNPPAITTHVGAVEEWTIENHSGEVHEFHIHQIHFKLLEINGKPVPPEQRQYLDTVQVPYWSGTGPYPNVKIKLDFRGNISGDFVITAISWDMRIRA